MEVGGDGGVQSLAGSLGLGLGFRKDKEGPDLVDVLRLELLAGGEPIAGELLADGDGRISKKGGSGMCVFGVVRGCAKEESGGGRPRADAGHVSETCRRYRYEAEAMQSGRGGGGRTEEDAKCANGTGKSRMSSQKRKQKDGARSARRKRAAGAKEEEQGGSTRRETRRMTRGIEGSADKGEECVA